MANSCDSNGFAALRQLVEDPIGANPKRVQAVELAAKGVTGEWVALEQAKRVLDRVDKRPVEVEKVSAGPPSENESRQRSACT